MTLARGPELVRDAARERRAVLGLTTYTLESTLAICRAAEAAELPVIIQISGGAFDASAFAVLAGTAISAANACGQHVGVHLDHSRSIDEVLRSIELGFTSVMIDGSQLPFDENVALTSHVVREAHRAGVWVEGEIGVIAGSEHATAAYEPQPLTDPGQAAAFAEATEVDVLAAAVGTVHGFSPEPVHVDLDRLAEIVAVCGVPLALHGASGVADDELVAAVHLGAAKVNINAELRRGYFRGLRGALDHDGDDVLSVQRAVIGEIESIARDRLELVGRSRDGEAW